MLDENGEEIDFNELDAEEERESEFKPEMVADTAGLAITDSEGNETDEPVQAVMGFDDED